MQKASNKLDCDFIRDNLFSYQENKLSGEKKQMFEDHLLICHKCTQLVQYFKSISKIFEAKRSDEPNPFIETRTIQRIEAELKHGNIPAFTFSHRIFQPLLVSIIIFVASLIGFSLGKEVDKEISINLLRQNDIQTMKSDLYITDFMDENNTIFNNH
ncbi:MAG: zf-HC2 domain-containing protein [Bacteroidales bacterium]|jgi:predicted anti-sigma-YlaC factor YlaD|nr:zf-HC2 domain-containing protein [Bacteroidales bacterium]